VTARSRASAVVAGAVAGLPPASLAEVIERAALQARVDRKYLVPVDRFAELISRLPSTWAALEIDGLRGFAYESVYFDTPDLLSYRQHLQGRRRRYKVRTRAYLDSADCAFEVKLKGRRDQTVKARLPYQIANRARIIPPARAFLADRLREGYGRPVPRLGPVVTTAYRRTTLVDLERGTRLTCDVDLTCGGAGRSAAGLPRPGGDQEPRAAQRARCRAPRPWPAPGPDQQVLRRRGAAAPGHPRQPVAPDAAALLRRRRMTRPGRKEPTMRFRRPILIGACLGVALSLAACGNGPDASTAQPSAPSTTAAPAPSPSPPATAAARGAEDSTGAALRAVQAAAEAVPQGRVYDLDRERHNGKPVWSVKVAATRRRQLTLTVISDGTRVLDRRRSARPDLDDLQDAHAATITASRAVRLAARRHPGRLDELELDSTDAGILVWRADLTGSDNRPTVIALDARTGAVVTTPDDATPDD
jgi:hypothetical protein